MRVEGLDIALRRRGSWEAVDLGVALVRRHARTIFISWLIVTGIVFVLLNALLLPFELGLLAALLLWWLKPVFDRIPVYVLSRAILGDAPDVRQTLRAQRRFEWRRMLPWLLWRRLHPARSMLLPVDLLEGLGGAARGERVRVLARGEGSTPVLLWVIGAHLELMLWASMIVFGLMLVPADFLSEAAKGLLDTWLEQPPWWIDLIENLLYWIAMCVIEPVYAGAGFALYLNRRTQLEAWDIELAFRRLAARVAPAVAVLALLLIALHAPPASAAVRDTQHRTAMMLATGAQLKDDAATAEAEAADAAHAQPSDQAPVSTVAQNKAEPREVADEASEEDSEEDSEEEENAAPLSQWLPDAGEEVDPDFAQALSRILEDPQLYPSEQRGEWKLRSRDDKPSADGPMPAWVQAIGGFVALVVENLLWILLALALLLLLLNARRWLPWFGRGARTPQPAARDELRIDELPPELPDDPSAAVLALWQAGQARAALSLLYRAALQRLVEQVGRPLPPGATESDALRLATRLGEDRFGPVFARTVRFWQIAAYADRLPADAELHQLLDDWSGSRQPA